MKLARLFAPKKLSIVGTREQNDEAVIRSIVDVHYCQEGEMNCMCRETINGEKDACHTCIVFLHFKEKPVIGVCRVCRKVLADTESAPNSVVEVTCTSCLKKADDARLQEALTAMKMGRHPIQIREVEGRVVWSKYGS